MARPTSPVTTRLGQSIRAHRAPLSQEEAGGVCGIPAGTMSRVERGVHRPDTDTVVKLARWLGWTMEEVVAAASQPPDQE